MMYPALPFPSHTWRISHHQGILTPRVLNALLFAASTYQDSRDPAHEINSYLVANDIVPPNVRVDSQQPDVWRDYQQLLPELGLIPSTRGSRIFLSPAGLSFLDGGIGFKDLMTAQALRWQYPNGHNTARSRGDNSPVNFAEQQAAVGVLVKPAVLMWQVLDALSSIGEAATLSAAEIEHFLIPARRHEDLELIVDSIKRNRASRLAFPSGQTPQRRNASDWMKRLGQTHVFAIDDDECLGLSAHSLRNRDYLHENMRQLSEPATFWMYPVDGFHSVSWSLWYGTLDSITHPVVDFESPTDFGSFAEPEDEDDEKSDRSISLHQFDWRAASIGDTTGNATISSVYSADLSNSAHRLHDSMVRLIADACRKGNANVFSDPATVDLLIELGELELLIEVKSAISQNLAKKLRSALGQVTYYDFLRSRQTQRTRRKGIAVTLDVGAKHWSKEFLTDYLDVDFITLHEGKLCTYSQSREVSQLIS